LAKKKYRRKKEKDKEEESPQYSRFVGKYGQSPRRERTPEEKQEYKKLALFLLGWLILVASVYFAFVQFENETAMFVVMLVYLILAIALFFVWLIFNGGFKKIDVTKYEKPPEMGYDEFCKFIDKLKERQRKSKYFLILFMPFIVVLLVDYVLIRWIPDPEDTQTTLQNLNLILKFMKII